MPFCIKAFDCEGWENHSLYLWFTDDSSCLHRRTQLVFGAFRCLFHVVLSAYLPEFSHKCILKQYYINHNITQWIVWRLSLECPHAYWITKPEIEICSSYVPITTCREGSNLRGCSLRLSKGFKALPGIVYCNRYACCNEMFYRFQAWSVLSGADVASKFHPSHTDSMAR